MPLTLVDYEQLAKRSRGQAHVLMLEVRGAAGARYLVFCVQNRTRGEIWLTASDGKKRSEATLGGRLDSGVNDGEWLRRAFVHVRAHIPMHSQ